MTRTPISLCRACGATLDAADGTSGHRQPKPGDVSMCIYCGEVSVFNPDMSLREPTAEERAELEADTTFVRLHRTLLDIVEKLRRDGEFSVDSDESTH